MPSIHSLATNLIHAIVAESMNHLSGAFDFSLKLSALRRRPFRKFSEGQVGLAKTHIVPIAETTLDIYYVPTLTGCKNRTRTVDLAQVPYVGWAAGVSVWVVI